MVGKVSPLRERRVGLAVRSRLAVTWLFLAVAEFLSAGSQPAVSGQSLGELTLKKNETLGRNQPARNLVLITLDGLRHEELFTGADLKLMTKQTGGVRDVETLRDRFWSEDPAVRRKSLLPFFWSRIVEKGQLIGDPELGSKASCTNGLYFSYPGYNELLTGKPDTTIDSNAKRPNPNQTVLEWLNGKPEFQGKVAVFGSWDVFPFIINTERSRIPVNAGWVDLTVGRRERIELLNRQAKETPRIWPNVRFDFFTFEGVQEYVRSKRPRVIYIAFGETDDWAHDGRYDLYLDAAFRTDQYIEKIWESLQQLPEYRNQTAMLISTDHGRGNGREGWKNHGSTISGSDRIWYAALGRGIAPPGNRRSIRVTQSQFASTAAGLLGLEFDQPGIAPPMDLKSIQ